jgi:pimeloyl-ACP methyl ester carboxylesterase
MRTPARRGGSRPLATLLAVVPLAMWSLTARSLSPRSPPPQPQTSRQTSTPPTTPPPQAAVERAAALRMGQLTLQPCNIGRQSASPLPTLAAWCTHLSVPENWRAPRGRQIGLLIAVLPPESRNPRPDLVTFLDGGPGGAATEDYPEVAGALAPLRARHGIVLVDQRGTGGSNPLSCPQLKPSAHRDEPSAGLDAPTALAGLLHACLAELSARAAPQFYTTSAAVRDLEAVREALGSPQLDLIGVSYGTRVAQQYVRRYPQAVRSVVLDSPVPNRVALLSEHARNLEQALHELFAQCRAQSGCAARFGDPYATLYRVRDRLRAHPASVTLRDPVSFEPLQRSMSAQDLADVVRLDSYSPLTAALLPLLLYEADQGNYAPLLGQKAWLSDDLGDQITSGLELSVLCAEDADLLAPRAEDTDTLLGNGPIERARAACQIWPRGHRPADFHVPLHATQPVLLLSGEFDPVTPPAYSREILQGLPHGRLLLAPGQGHSVIGAGCMPQLVQRFVDTLDTAALNVHCLQRLGPLPAFLNFDGAGP